MLLYLAARFGRRAELAGYAQRLTAMGHIVTSRWLDEPDTYTSFTIPPWVATQRAQADVEDVQKAEWVVVFPGGPSKGGYHVEFGLALAWGKPILIVGEKECVFHHLPGILHFETPDELLDALLFEAQVASNHGATNDRRPTPKP